MAPNRALANGNKAAVPDDVISFDIDDLTINEIEEFEDLVDLPFDEAIGAGLKKAKTMRAIAYLVKKRTNPDFTLEMAGELKLVLHKADPTDAAP